MRRAVLIVVALVALMSCSREGALSPVTQSGRTVPSSEPSVAPTGAGEDPAKAAFVKAANAACREYGADSDDLPDPEELDAYVPFMRDFIRIGDDLQAKLRALPVPPDDAKAIEGYLNANDEQSRVLKEALPKIEAAGRDDDIDAADEALSVALDEFNRISETQDPFARGYGLTDCANPVEDDGSSVEA